MKLSKDQIKDVEAQQAILAEKRKTFDEAADNYNKAVEAARASLEQAHAALEEAINDANSVVTSIGSEQRDAWIEKTEKWQKGDEGQAADEWIEKLENFEIEVPELPDVDPLDFSDMVVEEALDGDNFRSQSD